ncbi:hypothetical protein SI65_09938 [Aspergillus cristatus]|uniref:Uncharacterized protein n=1 Tax=Aspergillus cristatus TaxID=573508 RepID=A0A1E3B0Y2_ASPCR|nr:hypothetical protein SI65_09938 [Aspergillus cristatus]
MRGFLIFLHVANRQTRCYLVYDYLPWFLRMAPLHPGQSMPTANTPQIERAIHIHAQVHTNWTVRSNGTLIHGPIVSTGQIFIDEKLEQEIMALEPYGSHTEIEQLNNVEDGIYATESSTGAMTLFDTEPLDVVDYKNGVVGYITLSRIRAQARILVREQDCAVQASSCSIDIGQPLIVHQM